jgi:hypothetical protein
LLFGIWFICVLYRASSSLKLPAYQDDVTAGPLQ